MVLNPLNSASDSPPNETISAWDAIAQRQGQPAPAWWLVTQPDHAALAGDLAASIHSEDLPRLDADVIRAIGMHDCGWAAFDSGTPCSASALPDGPRIPRLNQAGRPLSFMDVAPVDFLPAWAASIARSEQISPIGGIIVSLHFTRLGEMRLSLKPDTSDDLQRLHNFLTGEATRRERLARQDRRSQAERITLLEVLQFCDLLSLYLCSGSRANVEFPQRFNHKAICLRRVGEECRVRPPLFGSGVSLGVSARRYPAGPGLSSVTLPFLLA